MKRNLFSLLLWALGYYRDPPVVIPQNFAFPNQIGIVDKTQPKITWIGHSTFLIEAYGMNFLTDPIWSEKITILGPKRLQPPPFTIDMLPPIDYVLISHNHYDHIDKKTLRYIYSKNPQIQWFVPKGVKQFFKRRLHIDSQVLEVDWKESCIDHRKEGIVTLTSTYAKHFSGRSIWDYNRSVWMGIMGEIRTVEHVKRFYFAGDTGYDPFAFKEIGNHFKKIDLALLPIGAYSPRQFMSPVHIDPAEAVKIHQEINANLSVGCHFGTYKLSSEKKGQPSFELYMALQKQGISPSQFRVLQPGQTINW